MQAEDGGPGATVALNRHLESENPATDSAAVARVWTLAYDELVAFEQKVLDRLQELMPTLGAEARREAELTNLPMIVQHLQTFKYRRATWRQRLEELEST